MPKWIGSVRRLLVGVYIGTLIFLVASKGSARGSDLAAEDVLEISSHLPSVGFTSKGTTFKEPDCLSVGKTECKLLLHSKGMYYFFQPIESMNPQPSYSRNLRLYVVPESEVSLVQLDQGIQ